MDHDSAARSPKRWVVAASLALLVVLAWAGQARASRPADGSAGPAPNGWLSSGDSGTPQTLADVRAEIGAGAGAAARLTGAGIGVALVDTGVAPVPGLRAAQVVNGPDLSFESQDSDLRYLDAYGHGTHLAGIIAANDTASGTTGLAPQAKLTSIRVGTSNGAVDVSQVLAAVDWVVVHKDDDPSAPIRVLNLAYGTSGGHGFSSTDALQFAVERAWKAGILVVAAVGNSGNNKITNPALDNYVLNVGSAATNGTASTSDDTVSKFSNVHGSDRSVDVLAPGESIESLRDPGSYVDTNYPGARVGTTLFRGSGTSQATAVTSAAAALLLQSRPSLTPDQAKRILVDSATALPATNKGYREINVAAALAMATPATTQTWTVSNGYGGLEAARGNSHVVRDGSLLTGDLTIWGYLSTPIWAPRSTAKTAWYGGWWMGFRLAGDGWTGSSWASRTWAAAGWAGNPWGAASTWSDPSWSGHYWSGSSWSGGDWSGHYWSSDDWTGDGWSTAAWN